MAVAEYITKEDLEDALKPIKAEMHAMEVRLESRLYTVKGDLEGIIEASEQRILGAVEGKLGAMEKRILGEIRNGRESHG